MRKPLNVIVITSFCLVLNLISFSSRALVTSTSSDCAKKFYNKFLAIQQNVGGTAGKSYYNKQVSIYNATTSLPRALSSLSTDIVGLLASASSSLKTDVDLSKLANYGINVSTASGPVKADFSLISNGLDSITNSINACKNDSSCNSWLSNNTYLTMDFPDNKGKLNTYISQLSSSSPPSCPY